MPLSPIARYFYWKTGSQWFWDLKPRNGRKISDGAEGYSSRHKCLLAIERHRHYAYVATVTLREKP